MQQAMSWYRKFRSRSTSGVARQKESTKAPSSRGRDGPTILQGKTRDNSTSKRQGETRKDVPARAPQTQGPVDPYADWCPKPRCLLEVEADACHDHDAPGLPTNATDQNTYRGGHTILQPAPWDPKANNIEHIDKEAYRQGLGIRPLPPQPKPDDTPMPQWFIDRLPRECQDDPDFNAAARLRYQHGQLPEACARSHRSKNLPLGRDVPLGCEPDDAYEAVHRASYEEHMGWNDDDLREAMWSSSNSRSAMWMGGEMRRSRQVPLAESLSQARAPPVGSLPQPPASQPPPRYNSTAPVLLEFSFKEDLPTSPPNETGRVHFSRDSASSTKAPIRALEVVPPTLVPPTYLEWSEANARSGIGATILVGEGPQLAPLNFTPQLTLFLQMSMGAQRPSPVQGAYGKLRRAFSEEPPKRRPGMLPKEAGPSLGSRPSPISDADQRKEVTIGACIDPCHVQLVKASKGGTLGLHQLPALPPRADLVTGSGTVTQDGQRTLRRTISSGNLTIASVGGRTCPICMEENVKSSNMETFGCGIHSICAECFMHMTVDQLAQNNIPRCPMTDCRMPLDALVALRLLDKQDMDKYLMLTLFANPRYMVCPNCKENLFSEVVPPCAETVNCPMCDFVFCADCRCSIHPNMTCEEAMKKAEAERVATGDALPEGVKACPRCMAPVYKEDDGSCDHMTCARCKQEYCWTCLADRSVIFAHGNHYHMPSCRFYFEYDGPDEYLPDRCIRCKLRGSACRKPQAASDSSPQAVSLLWDFCMKFVRSLMSCDGTSQTHTTRTIQTKMVCAR